MKAKIIAIGAAAGLAFLVGNCSETESEPNITRIDYFDGSFEINRISPDLHFRHDELNNQNLLTFETQHEWVGIYDKGCDGIADEIYIDINVYYPNMPGTEAIFKKANKVLADTKKELGI
ncbi:MAG: hypothetical protein WC852_02510 [Candidatus Nanoarchaeia archaeon]|jgi:hypothetical protein